MATSAQMMASVGTRKEELKHLLTLALPTMITQLLRFLNPSISIMVCGHLSREELDASSLAITLINVLGLSVDTGFATAFDTLFSQAYGSRQKKVLGLILQRALCVVFVMFSVLACLHVNIGPILFLLKQDPLISSLTAEYLFCFLPGLACDFLFLTFGRFLQAQNIVLPMLFSSCLGTLFNVSLQYLFVVRLNLGIRTSALCLSCSFAFMLFCVLMYFRLSDGFGNTWAEIDYRAVLSNWGIIFRLGIPGLFMVALEEWCFETLTFIAGSISEVTLGAHAIAFQIQSIIYMVPLGIFTAVNVRVGQKLGAFNPSGARFAYTTALGLIPVVATCTAGPVIILRHSLPLLFTEDADVCQLASSLLPLLLIFQMFEGLAGVSEAVLLACGRQSTGATVIFIGYYCIGMPLAFILSYRTNLGIYGAWLGLMTGFGITTITYSVLAIRTNWVEEARQAHYNINAQQMLHLNNVCGKQDILATTDVLIDTATVQNGSTMFQTNYLQTARKKIVQQNSLLEASSSKGWRGGWRFYCSYIPNGVPLRTVLLVLLVVFWISAFCLSMKQPVAVWRSRCMPITTEGQSVTLPSFCERMSREDNQFPFNLMPFKLPQYEDEGVQLPSVRFNETQDV